MRYVIGLGSSLGPGRRTLELAVALLHRLPGTRVVACSRLYRSAPAGGLAWRPFLNGAVLVSSEARPLQLLAWCKELETRLGRRPSARWADRVVDLDLLWWEGGALEEPSLQLPHPRLMERDFALAPLLEVLPGARDPKGGRPLGEHPRPVPRARPLGVLARP